MRVSHDLLLERSNLLDLDMRDVKVDTSASPPLSPTISKTWGVIGDCRRPSAVVNSNCVTNRVAPGSRYKLSYGAEQYNNTHSSIYLIPATHAPNRATETQNYRLNKLSN
jgi:hypothetical protein